MLTIICNYVCCIIMVQGVLNLCCHGLSPEKMHIQFQFISDLMHVGVFLRVPRYKHMHDICLSITMFRQAETLNLKIQEASGKVVYHCLHCYWTSTLMLSQRTILSIQPFSNFPDTITLHFRILQIAKHLVIFAFIVID